MLRSLQLLFTVMLLAAACSPRIVRSGYQAQKKDYWDCGLAMKKDIVDTSRLVYLGRVDLKGCKGAYTSRDSSLRILMYEGCALEADSIRLLYERYASDQASCYECAAEFYARKKPDSPTYMPDEDSLRGSAHQSNKAKTATAAAVALGVILLLRFIVFTPG